MVKCKNTLSSVRWNLRPSPRTPQPNPKEVRSTEDIFSSVQTVNDSTIDKGESFRREFLKSFSFIDKRLSNPFDKLTLLQLGSIKNKFLYFFLIVILSTKSLNKSQLLRIDNPPMLKRLID